MEQIKHVFITNYLHKFSYIRNTHIPNTLDFGYTPKTTNLKMTSVSNMCPELKILMDEMAAMQEKKYAKEREKAAALQAKEDAELAARVLSRKAREPKFNDDGSPQVRKTRQRKFNDDGSPQVRKTRQPKMDGSRNYLTVKQLQEKFSGSVNKALFTRVVTWRDVLKNGDVTKHMTGKALEFEEKDQEKALEAMTDLCVVLKDVTVIYSQYITPHTIDNQSRVTKDGHKGCVLLSVARTIAIEAIALHRIEPQDDGEEDEEEQKFLNDVKKGHNNLSRVLEAITPFLPKNQSTQDVLDHILQMVYGFQKQRILPTYVIGDAEGDLSPCEIIDFKHYKPAWQRRTKSSLLPDGQRSNVGTMSAFRSEPKPVSEDKPVSSRKRRKAGVDTDDSAQVTPAMAIIVVDDDDRPAKVSKGSPTVPSPPVPPVPEFSDPSVQAVLAQAYPV
jgi:hypothetical protein